VGLLDRLTRRRGPDPLGDGVWRRAHDRFLRAVERVHQVASGPDEDAEVTERLIAVAASLGRLLPQVGAVCAAAQAAAPSAGLDVPSGGGGRFLDVHRALSKAAGLAAQAAEAATMARIEVGAGVAAAAGARAGAGERAAAGARDLVLRAEALLTDAEPSC